MKCSLGVSNFLEEISAAAANSVQSCPTLCDPIDSSPPGSPVPGILQARTLEWVAISFSNVRVKSLSCVRLVATPWTVALQAPPSMGFSRQQYWSGCHCLLRNFTGKEEVKADDRKKWDGGRGEQGGKEGKDTASRHL